MAEPAPSDAPRAPAGWVAAPLDASPTDPRARAHHPGEVGADHPDGGLRPPPGPRRGGPIALLRFMRRNRMLRPRYVPLLANVVRLKLRHGRRIAFDGPAFVPWSVRFEIAPGARVELGRFSWIGHGTKVRAHGGVVRIGAKTVLGQECTLTAFEHLEIGRECIVADRAMFLDFDHGTVEVERPIRLQGIYTEPVVVGHDVWVGYGACVLRGVRVGDHAIVGTNAVVTRDVAPSAVVGGAPARVLRRRESPRRLRYR